jgi:ATP-dependent helicase HrpB
MAFSLPIDALRPDLEAAWAARRNFILRAPTGSGKSTRVPRFLLEWDRFPADRTVLVLQPRRMAARMLARRVAHELGEPLGGRVGYRVRFEAVASERTRLLFVTEGLLLRMLTAGDGLRGVGAILFDEFHERHLEGDVGLGLAVERQAEGWDGRIGVFSATLETEELKAYLPEAEVLESAGREYPVTVDYLGGKAGEPLWEAGARGFREAVRRGAEGDVLIFMPGKREILRILERIGQLPEARGWERLPLHGEMEARDQDEAAGEGTRPRVIVSTNIAETSLTIPGIRTVIDCGYARIPDYDPRRGVNTLLTEKISRASAEQRAGRAGRTAPGRCFRLWSRAEQEYRPERTRPEIERLDLAETRLQLAALGRQETFPWLAPPPVPAWKRAGQLLEDLGATTGGTLTRIGREMARLPLHPRFSRILLAARERQCLPAVTAAIAFLQGREIILPIGDKRRERERESWWDEAEGVSDLLPPLHAWERIRSTGGDASFCREWGLHVQGMRQGERVYAQLMRILGEKNPTGSGGTEAFCRSILAGYVDQLAKRKDRGSRRCELVHGRRGELRRGSLVGDAALFVAADVEEREFRGETTVFLGSATVVEEEWLKADYPEAYRTENGHRMDPVRRRVERVRQTRFHDLVLEEETAGDPDPAVAAAMLAESIQREGWVLKKWDHACETWIRRVRVMAENCPELELKPIADEDRQFLIEQICEGATAYKEVKDREVMPVLETWLPESLAPLLDDWVPLRFALPGGPRVKLRYEADGTVVLPARIQQLYDVPGDSLTICQGRKPLRLEILAPNGRPVQITDDLDGFWEGQYPQIRKDLFGRYPKHEWR